MSLTYRVNTMLGLNYLQTFDEYFFMPSKRMGIDFKCGTVHFTKNQLATFIHWDYIKYPDFLENLSGKL